MTGKEQSYATFAVLTIFLAGTVFGLAIGAFVKCGLGM